MNTVQQNQPALSDREIEFYRLLVQDVKKLETVKSSCVTAMEERAIAIRGLQSSLDRVLSAVELEKAFDTRAQINLVAKDLANSNGTYEGTEFERALQACRQGKSYKRHVAATVLGDHYEKQHALAENRKEIKGRLHEQKHLFKEFDSKVRKILQHQASVTGEMRRLRTRVCSPLELYTSAEREKIYEMATHDPSFKKVYDAYAAATNATAQTTESTLQQREWAARFAEAVKDVPRHSPSLSNAHAYFMDVQNKPRRNERGLALTHYELFFVAPEVDKPVADKVQISVKEEQRPRGLFYRVTVAISGLYR